MRTILLALLLLLSACSLFAQAPANPKPKATLESSIPGVAYPLTISDGKLTGSGAPILQTAISQADYVLLGEDHITHEIPQFATLICDAMGVTGGFSAMAFEASPAAAEFVQQSLNSSDRIQKMADLQKRYPNSV